MSALPPSLLETLDADQSLWPGPEPRAALERWFASVPGDVRDALLSALVDPDRHAWSRAALWGIDLAVAGGATPTGLANDEVVELTDRRGERFGLVPIEFRPPTHPFGSAEGAGRLLQSLDRAFDHRRYIVSIRRPVPVDLDVGPITTAVQLWLAQLDRGPGERTATYEDGDIAVDLTLVEGSSGKKGSAGGRLLTFGPMEAMELLGQVDGALVEAASRCEESLGSLALVMVVAYEQPWRVPRGFVQQLLYGTPDVVRVDGMYEAEFTANGRSLFSDPSARGVSALWWIGPRASGGHRAYENPWAAGPVGLAVPPPHFSPIGEPDRRRRVALRWHR